MIALDAAKQALLNLGFSDASGNGPGDPEVIAINKAMAALPAAREALKSCIQEFGEDGVDPDEDWLALRKASAAIKLIDAA